MIEIQCSLKQQIKIEKGDFYVFKDLNSSEEYLIPTDLIDKYESIDFTRPQTFLKEYIDKTKKTYLRFVHPNYKIGTERTFSIKKKIDSFFHLKSEVYKDLVVDAFPWQKNINEINCKIVGYKKDVPVLRNIDTKNTSWEQGKNYTFKIIGFGKLLDKKNQQFDTIQVESIDGQIEIRAGQWHRKDIWKFDDIICKVVGITYNGLPKLTINDNRHPFYLQGGVYEFAVQSFETKTLASGTKIEVIKILGEKDIPYEVLALPNQANKLKKGDKINCEVTEINTRVNLWQSNNIDPYFYSFDEIINDEELKNNYFVKYLNSKEHSSLKLNNQYNSKSGFWVFTYCNQIIPAIKENLIERKHYLELIKVLKLNNEIEKWILNKGILKAFFNENERDLTKIKIEHVIKNNIYEIETLSKITSYKEDELLNGDLKDLYYYLKYSNPQSINFYKIISILSKIEVSSINSNSYDFSFLKKIEKIVHRNRLLNKVISNQAYFIHEKRYNYSIKKIKRFCYWLLIQIKLNELIGETEEKNLLISKFYRVYSNTLTDNISKKKLLLNSFYVLNNIEKDINPKIYITDNEININLKELRNNPNLIKTNENIKSNVLLANVIERNNHGFNVKYGQTNGFLPIQNVTDNQLKKAYTNKIYWETNLEATIFSKEFNFFIGRQISIDSENYYSENKLEINLPQKGAIIIGQVKAIKEFGVFVSTDFGDGLIHKSQISDDYYFDYSLLDYFFEINSKIPLYVLNNEKDKLEFSTKELKEKGFIEEYNRIFNFENFQLFEYNNSNTDSDNVDLSGRTEIEKAFIFENFAILQNSFENKIKYLKFSKAFYSNTKNSRSYLINIYIDYFQSLIKLDKLITNYSIAEYDLFRNEIRQIKDKIQQKTLENFPETKNLLFFIDILNLYNKTSEEDLEILFNLTKMPIEENDQLLKVVSKTVLANNLILSETDMKNEEEVASYTLRNLKRIREFISQGVLSLEDTVDDKREQQLKEQRLYWKKVINEDEGQKLEFKATFVTPIQDSKKSKIIFNLEKKLENEADEIKIKSIKEKIDEINATDYNDKFIQKKIMHSAMKTICAFANTEGGVLLLGVTDDKKIYGLEQDYAKINNNANRDEFGKYFDSQIKEYFGNSFSSSFLHKEFLKYPEGDILIIEVKKSNDEIFLLKDDIGNKSEQLYVRNLSSSEKLDGIELSKFIKKRYLEYFGAYTDSLNKPLQ